MQNPPMTRAESTKKDPAQPVRNLTYEGIKSHMLQLMADELKGISPYAVSTVHLPEKDKQGNVVKDEHGFVKLLTKTVLTRDLKQAEWEEKIASLG
jgi:hypothetical protein